MRDVPRISNPPQETPYFFRAMNELFADTKQMIHAIARIRYAYSDNYRVYHTLSYHIEDMLRIAYHWREDGLFSADREVTQWKLLLASIIFHDIEQKLVPSMVGLEPDHNEKTSGIIAQKFMQEAGYSDQFTEDLTTLIYVTFEHQTHNVRPTIELAAKMLCDLDLYRLGETWEELCHDTELLRLEYSPIATDKTFADGRKSWAAQFLKGRDTIFQTDRARHRESQARDNLNKTVRGLFVA